MHAAHHQQRMGHHQLLGHTVRAHGVAAHIVRPVRDGPQLYGEPELRTPGPAPGARAGRVQAGDVAGDHARRARGPAQPDRPDRRGGLAGVRHDHGHSGRQLRARQPPGTAGPEHQSAGGPAREHDLPAAQPGAPEPEQESHPGHWRPRVQGAHSAAAPAVDQQPRGRLRRGPVPAEVRVRGPVLAGRADGGRVVEPHHRDTDERFQLVAAAHRAPFGRQRYTHGERQAAGRALRPGDFGHVLQRHRLAADQHV